MSDPLDDASILVTGGTGSFGRAFIERLLKRAPRVRRVVVYSRDEQKQHAMAQVAPFAGDDRMRFFLGDVRDRRRLQRALAGVDLVVHAAALKIIPAGEYNPFEVIKTNVLGAQNLIEACLDRPEVKRVVALSTDKAAAPINLYGASKLCADKLFVAANLYTGFRDLRFSVVRYGNVLGSRGSVVPFFLERCQQGALPLTDLRMTRFNITLDEGVDLVLNALERAWGGEIFVPRIPSYRLVDVAEAIAPGAAREVVGLRPGEKLHEDMITATDALSSLELDDCFVISPTMPLWELDDYVAAHGARPCPEGFSYNSGTNAEWLSVEQLRDLIRRHVDPDFEPLQAGT